ncbi:MAG: nuclease-related domain-containing protein [Kiritimatiellia bacterium]
MKQKAEIVGEAGEDARTRGILRGTAPLVALAAAIGLLAGLAAPRELIPEAAVWILLAAIVGGAVAYATTLRKSLTAYFTGARGERMTARLLEKLPQGWVVFHEVERYGADHIAIGPGGIFCIETKCWQGQVADHDGTLLVDGRRPSRDPLEQVRRTARVIRQDLLDAHLPIPELEVEPLVCFVTGTLQGNPPNCVNGDRLLPRLLNAPGRLNATQIQLLADHFKQ